MQSSASTNDEFSRHYATAIDALYEIANAYFFLGRLGDALRLLRTSLHMIEEGEVAQKDRLKLLLLYGKVLTVDHLMNRGDTDLMFSTILQAKQIAEAAEVQQSMADALSLLGQAHCNATTVAIVKSGSLPFGTQGRGNMRKPSPISNRLWVSKRRCTRPEGSANHTFASAWCISSGNRTTWLGNTLPRLSRSPSSMGISWNRPNLIVT